VIHGKGEGEVQTYATNNEALIKDIDHGDADKQPPPWQQQRLQCYGGLAETSDFKEI